MSEIMIANDVWNRYTYMRDRGHIEFVDKANRCEDFFAGLQWDKADLAALRMQKRPAMTINKIISTISNVMGEQIFNRVQIAFKPRNEGATAEVADALTKVFSQINDNNQLDWVRSDIFADGIITSRGFYDVRLGFGDSLMGEVHISQLNPKNVLVDPDADEYDPDMWGDVIVTKWLTPDDIELLYSKEQADLLRSRGDSYFPYGFDSIERSRDRFGTNYPSVGGDWNSPSDDRVARNIRVIERQWRKLKMCKFFVDLKTGDMREVPYSWDRDRIAKTVEEAKGGITVIKKQTRKIRWTVIADSVVLHDDWSPYKHFTVVPYFPFFRRGRTIGLVENLLGPQEILNKVSSQELHVVNTAANSGWKVKTGALTNMSVEELEQRGAQTGLVIEVNDMEGIDKINPNQVPTGLDRISGKTEEHIKTISGVPDYATGFAREDVAAKSVVANQKASQKNMAKVIDNLNRTDFILARNVLDLVQEFYTEERLIYITSDRLTGDREAMTVNQVTPEGRIANDLTLGEYIVVVTNQPERDTFEDSQFEQALGLHEKGIPIPPEVIINNSRLKDKAEIVKQMRGDQESPEAQFRQQLALRKEHAETALIEANTARQRADAAYKVAKAKRDLNDPQNPIEELNLEKYKIDQQIALERWKAEQELALEREKLDAELNLKREEARMKAEVEQEKARQQALMQRAQAAHAAARPQPAGGTSR